MKTDYEIRKIIKIVLMAFCITIALKYSEGNAIKDVTNMFENSGFTWTVVFLAFCMLFRKYCIEQSKRIDRVAAAMAVLLSGIMVIGNIIKTYNDISLSYFSKLQLFILLISFIGYSILFYFFILKVFVLFYRDDEIKIKIIDNQYVNKFLKLYEEKPFIWSFAVIFICWLPYLIVTYPGSISYDGGTQLFQIMGYAPLTNHHPVLSTILMGICLRVGQKIHSDNLGIFIYTLLQSTAFAMALALSVSYLKKLKISLKFRLCTLVFFSLFSLWPMYAQWYVKDTLFAAMTLVYFVCMIKLVKNDYKHFYQIMLLIVIVGCLVALLRNNGIYIVILSLPFAAINMNQKRNRVWILIASVIMLVSYSGFNNIVLKGNNIEGSSKKEMLSLPFQQTANYIRSYSDQVTEQEREAIDRVLDYDTIPNIYNPSLADPVKETYKCKMLSDKEQKEALSAYFKVWGKQLLKHPLNYIKTGICVTYDYYYPENKHVLGTSHVSIGNESFMQIFTGFINEYQLESFAGVRTGLAQFHRFMINMPFISIFDYAGIYTWIYFICFIVLLRKHKYRELTSLFAPIVVILVCLVSPVNGTSRYMLPAMIGMPLFVAYVRSLVRTKNN